jgi:hypothetical protein
MMINLALWLNSWVHQLLRGRCCCPYLCLKLEQAEFRREWRKYHDCAALGCPADCEDSYERYAEWDRQQPEREIQGRD